MNTDRRSSDDPLWMERSDERFTGWMHQNLSRAAAHFRVTVTAAPTLGWRLRSIGAPATGVDGPRWLRVVTDYPRWASGPGWSGNQDNNVLSGINKPALLDQYEWGDGGRRQRAEVLTLLPGSAVSQSEVLRHDPALGPDWWIALSNDLARLRAASTSRINIDQDSLNGRSSTALGMELPVDRWETVHGDLHWANLLAPRARHAT